MSSNTTKTNQNHSPFSVGATPKAIGFCGGNSLFVEQRSTANYYTPYKFSGKEKDEETSYSYFGARYYMSDVSVWLSVDPMKDKYPNMSPYMYCAGNPVKFVDPNGEEPILFGVLQKLGQVKGGRDNPHEAKTIGEYSVVPFYNNGNLIGYNALRKGANGEYRTEYQMGSNDLEDFTQNIGTYTAGANLVYSCGEPNWDYVMMSYNLMQMNGRGVVNSLGSAWVKAANDPGFYVTLAFAMVAFKVNVAELSPSNFKAPRGFVSKVSKKGGGIVFHDPANTHNSLRIMPGNPNSPNVAQQNPYVIFKKNGVTYDVNGSPLLNASDPAAHIPLKKFNPKNMPSYE